MSRTQLRLRPAWLQGAFSARQPSHGVAADRHRGLLQAERAAIRTQTELRPTLYLFIVLWLTAFAQANAENWHQWRGPENNGVSPTATPPLTWSETENLAWKAAIPGLGTASPIVWGGRVFVLTAVDTDVVDPTLPKPEDQPERVFGITFPNTRYEMMVLCFDRQTGRERWRDVATRLVPHEGHHRDASFASASPFCDGERLYCWFGSAGLFAYSLDGKKLWERKLGKAKVGASLGEGSSPVVHDGKLVLVRDHAGQSSITALNAATGETLWTKDRDEGNAWATPAIVEHDGVTQVITSASKQVRAYNLDTGDLIWFASGLTANCAPCPIVKGETVYCMSGYKGYALLAIPITGQGDVTDSIRWRLDRGTPYVPSPLLYDNQLYFTQSNQNILSAVDVKDGRTVIERTRLPEVTGIYASPVAAANRIYIAARNGKTLVIEHGNAFKVLASNSLDDQFHASPALAGNQLFLRGKQFLYCLQQGVAEAAKRPNVVTLLVDDLGYRDIGCYGGPVKTPVLDKLAAEGVRFTDFHSGAPTCSPSRATFLTGRHHYRTGVYSVISEPVHKMHLLRSETTIAEVLSENGYATAHFGKWHLGMPTNKRQNPTPTDHGFDYWFGLVNGAHPNHKDPVNFLRNGKPVGPMKGYSCQIVVDEALTWLDEKRAPDAPFFLNLWFNEPHAVIAAPDEIVSQYGALDDQAAIYNGTIDNTDRAIGRLVAKLQALGELDNTIIVYSSDNGSYLQARSGELRGKKGSQFEGGHRVPGIFHWKDGIPGERVEAKPAGSVDLLPTLCGLIGIAKPRGVHLDGSDLAPLLTGTGTFQRHQPLFWMSQANMVLRMGDHTLFASGTAGSPIDFKASNRLIKQVEDVLGDDLENELGGLDLRSRMFNGRFKNPEANRLQRQHRELYYFQESWIPELKKGGIGRVQLYDLSKDIGQQNDIAKARPELVAQMTKKAEAIYASVMADAPEWLTPEELAAAKKPTAQPAAAGTSALKAADLLAHIDKNSLPKGYHGSRHQAYVDRVMASLKPEQRTRIGQLWKEKRRLDPDMPNRGASFVRILTHVAEEAGRQQ